MMAVADKTVDVIVTVDVRVTHFMVISFLLTLSSGDGPGSEFYLLAKWDSLHKSTLECAGSYRETI